VNVQHTHNSACIHATLHIPARQYRTVVNLSANFTDSVAGAGDFEREHWELSWQEKFSAIPILKVP